MARTPIAAGNWKMNGANSEARALCRGLAGIDSIAGVDVVLSPSFTQLPLVWDFWCGTDVHIAGQNMHTQPRWRVHRRGLASPTGRGRRLGHPRAFRETPVLL